MARPRMTTKEFVKKATKKHGEFYDYSQVSHTNSDHSVTITCPKHGPFTQNVHVHLNGKGCGYCGTERAARESIAKAAKSFNSKANKKHNGRYKYDNVVYLNNLEKVAITCSEHGDFLQSPANHLAGTGCPDCANALKKSTDDFIAEARQAHGSEYDYSKAIYNGPKNKITIICSKHGKFKQTPFNHTRGRTCPKCAREGKSKGEEKIAHFLTKHNIIFISEKRFSDCRHKHTLPFDFFLPEQGILIEYDGKQHALGGWGRSAREFRKTDKVKDEWAKKSPYTLVRIPHTDFDNIETILTSLLCP